MNEMTDVDLLRHFAEQVSEGAEEWLLWIRNVDYWEAAEARTLVGPSYQDSLIFTCYYSETREIQVLSLLLAAEILENGEINR